MEKEEKEIRKVLDAVSSSGTYNTGHILWLLGLIEGGKNEVREGIKELLNINDCDYDH